MIRPPTEPETQPNGANMQTDFHVVPASWNHDAQALQALRRSVFVDEQAVPEAEEWDGIDPECQHVLARSLDGTPIGCGRLTPQGQIGRMAVVADWRGRGVGAALLTALLDQARQNGLQEVRLHAQHHAVGFYQRHGFQAHGDCFEEAGITHQAMHRDIAPWPEAPARRGRVAAPPAARSLDCETHAELLDKVLTLLQQARHRIDLHSRHLLPMLADDDKVLVELRRMATSGRQARLRFLIHNPEQLLRDGHRLLALAQRMETAIEIRQVHEREDRQYPSAFLLDDTGGYLLQARFNQPRASGSTHAPGRHHPLGRYFEEVWQRSVVASALRRLDL